MKKSVCRLLAALALSLSVSGCAAAEEKEIRIECQPVEGRALQTEYVFPAAMVVFGYPTQQQLRREKPHRSPRELIVHENGYHRMDKDQLRQLLEVKSGQPDFEQWLRAFCQRKYNSDFSREMTRSVEKYLDEYRD